jgi:ParB-like chromosome segregation protein Spo0J
MPVTPTEIKLGIVALVLLIVAGFSGYAGYRIGGHRADTIRVADLKQAAADSEKALAQLEEHNRAANAAVAQLQQQLAQRQTRTRIIKKVIHEQPKTQACVSSPAIKSMLSGLASPGWLRPANERDTLSAPTDTR